MTPNRTTLQKQISDNIEYGESILTMLKRKAESQLDVIAPAQDEQIVEFWKVLLDIHTVADKLGRERYRLSVIQA